MICPNCKKELIKGANFCTYCGAKINQLSCELSDIPKSDKQNNIDNEEINNINDNSDKQLCDTKECASNDNSNDKVIKFNRNIKFCIGIIIILGLVVIYNTNTSNALISGKWIGINSDGAPVVLEMSNGKFNFSLADETSNAVTLTGMYSISKNTYKDDEYNVNFYILNLMYQDNPNGTKVRVKFNNRSTMLWATTEGSKDLLFNRVPKKMGKPEQYLILLFLSIVIYKLLIKKTKKYKKNKINQN